MASFYAGDELTVTATFKDDAGTETDPTGATLSYRAADSTADPTEVDLASMTKDSTGVYHTTIDTTDFAAGAWTVQIVGTGAVAAVNVERFVIEARPLG